MARIFKPAAPRRPEPEFRPPRFSDTEAVLALFDDEDLREWSSEWPWFDDDPKDILQRAVEMAEQGSPSELIRLVKDSMKERQKRGRGRPKGSKTSKSKREATTPIHRAASMVPLAKTILKDLYPEQSDDEIFDCALLVVERIFNDGDNVTVEKLATYLRRGPKDRRRLV